MRGPELGVVRDTDLGSCQRKLPWLPKEPRVCGSRAFWVVSAPTSRIEVCERHVMDVLRSLSN